MKNQVQERENVELHNSWLALNSIVGCTNGCRYCFLGMGKNYSIPRIYASPEEVINELLNFRYYDSSIPLCLFPNTDIFLNQENIEYLLEVLKLIMKYEIKNDLVVVTKCLIPEVVLKKFQEMRKLGYTIVVYLSYSGLDHTIEPNVNHHHILKNFENLKKYHIPHIHYYRPFLPQNSDPLKIKQVLDTVHPFTSISVVTGLMVDSNNNCAKIWENLSKISDNISSGYSSIWPESAWNYFHKDYDHKQLCFRMNSCAYATLLKRSCSIYYNSRACRDCRCCGAQRKRCHLAYFETRKNIQEKLNYYLLKIGITSSYFFHLHGNNRLELVGNPLKPQDYIYLSHMLGLHVFMKEQTADKKYNAFQGEPYILKEEV